MAAFLLYQLIASQNAAPQNPANVLPDGDRHDLRNDV